MPMVNALPLYKKAVVYTVMAMIGLVIFLVLASIAVDLAGAVLDDDFIVLSKSDVLKFIGNFLLIVVCIELMDTMLAYAKKQEVHVEIVILVALTAVARELIVFDYETVDAAVLAGIGAAIIALSASFFLIRRSRHADGPQLS